MSEHQSPEKSQSETRGRKSSRRKVSIHDASRWVFNRMADVYGARPAYPTPLVDAVVEVAKQSGKRIGDVGAGIGHLSLPLAERGFDVTAVEPALAMLNRLQASALARGLAVRCVHGAAEALPVDSASLDLVVIADALHFIDTELAAREISRVLSPGGALMVISCKLGSTPFMRSVARIVEEATQRKPRPMVKRRAQLAGVSGIALEHELRLSDETTVNREELQRILASISFVGPAMNPTRTAAFHARIQALASDHSTVWARTFIVRWGKRPQR